MNRGSGVLMHITSLPGKYGIGTLGRKSYEFADFLSNAGQRYWQILPIGQTSYGDSPYQSFSSFAGNPYLIDFDLLNEEGLLNFEDYNNIKWGNNEEEIDYELIFNEKLKVLKKAYENFKSQYNYKEEFINFKNQQYKWLNDYALYMAVKGRFNLVSWQEWDEGIKFRNPEEINRYKNELNDEIEYWSFLQYEFYKQWYSLKRYVNDIGIEIIGDIPIYVAEDSADCWSHPELFMLDNKTMKPISVSGCPPDAFSEDGQLWGNPIYNWDYLESTGYRWWIDRISSNLKFYDILRIDHFRGFESYWSIPAQDDTARNGKWVLGPGIKLFNAIKRELGNINVIAEDLGFMTDAVIKLRKETGFPGMKVLQFAFGSPDSPDIPHNYNDNNCVVYTGTHDNDTFRGWYEKSGSKNEVEYAFKYCHLTKEEGYNWGFIRTVLSSIGNTSIILMQDLLDLGADSRMNTPSTIGRNWSWRMKEGAASKELAIKLRDLTKIYGRCK